MQLHSYGIKYIQVMPTKTMAHKYTEDPDQPLHTCGHCIALDKRVIRKIFLSDFIIKTHCGIHLKHLSEVLLMSTTTCFHGEIIKIFILFFFFDKKKVFYLELWDSEDSSR